MVTRADRNTPLTKQDVIYADFLIDLTPHPVSGDVVRLPNERAVIRSMRNLLMTNFGERLYQPEIGTGLRSLLFEPLNLGTATAIENAVAETLRAYEPRAKIVEIVANPDYDNNAYTLTILFYIINKSEPTTFNITLTRAR